MNKILIIIPTYNEKDNITLIYKKISKLYTNFHILFVDDNSLDGTLNKLNFLKKINKNVFVKKRKTKLGIGSAHKEGIAWGYKNKYNYIITMDVDGTHNPIYIFKMLKIAQSIPIVITNRFLLKDGFRQWHILRRFLTRFRHFAVRKLLKLNDLDSSGAFRVYNTKLVKLSHIVLAKNNSYSFFFESLFIFKIKKYRIIQIPIYMEDRKYGNSKINLYEIFFAIYYLSKVFLSSLLKY
jgi:dolichol-phosphate mannosyltransferase